MTGLSSLTLHAGMLRIPFRESFKHAAATRSCGESLWVRAASACGIQGFGEGCPRHYVSGETAATCAAFFRQHRYSIEMSVTDIDSLRAWIQRHERSIDRNPAAWCAIELALLDLLGRTGNASIETLLELPALRGPYRYTAVLGDGDPQSFTRTLERYIEAGFSDYKLKLTGNPEQDRKRVTALRDVAVHLRVDANNLWANPETVIHHIENLDVPIDGLEEPLRPAGRIEDLASIADNLQIPVVLDESILRAGQLDAIAHSPGRWIVNLRVSKMGGLLRSLDLAARGRALGLRFVVGAQVGETSLLTRAAWPVAEAAGDALTGQEGAFGCLLLADDPCTPELRCDVAGLLDPRSAMNSGAPGLGLVVDGHGPRTEPLPWEFSQ